MEKTNDRISHQGEIEAASFWPPAIVTLSITTATIMLTFRHDIGAAIWTWSHIPTYYYCFLIAPISGYLVWQQRKTLATQIPAPSSAGVAFSLFCLVLWWAAEATLITEVRQVAVIGLLQGVAWAVLGSRLYRRLLFPLLLLFLMVPSGTVLLPPLQAVTTWLSGRMLDAAGVPIFVEGTTLEVPTGNYFVAPGCAGLNFLLAALTLSLLFGHQHYHRPWKRLLCVTAAVSIAVLANGVRVFGIIWLAEASHRHIDIVEDHLLYGWLFFSLIILASMALGFRFADAPAAAAAPPAEPPGRRPDARLPRALLSASLTIMIAALVIERSVAFSADIAPSARRQALNLPERIGAWRKVPADMAWSPNFPHADFRRRIAYRNNGRQIELFVAYYRAQRDGHKATGGENILVPSAEGALATDKIRRARAGTKPLDVATYHLSMEGRSLLLWSWYWVAGRQTADTLTARLLGLPGRLAGDNRAAALAVATDESPSENAATAALDDFLKHEDELLKVLAAQ